MAIDNPFDVLLVPSLFILLDVIAIILALVFRRRCPDACSLVILAAILNIFAALSQAGFQMRWMPGDNFARWTANGVMIVAVFAGRNRPTPTPYRPPRPDHRDDDDDWQAPAGAPALPKADATGIQEQKP